MDLRLVYDNHVGQGDLVLSGADLAIDTGLETAVIISLFTDRRAPEETTVPDGQRRGWFGDAYNADTVDQIGSHLWLLSREKRTAQTLQRARDYTYEALAWLVTDGVARAIDVQAQYVGNEQLQLLIEIARERHPPAQFRFDAFWSGAHAV
ncbi:phage GP46 family protein [Pseudoxanthomonas sp. UTMC 1351]|uniref:phage GP46 family protein n=1 Tax=Pseudoxanthomonas sp. UTMC 1351 TaxID=2695853 RepID=UPI0034CD2B43